MFPETRHFSAGVVHMGISYKGRSVVASTVVIFIIGVNAKKATL
ncbi:hypothetical protein [Lactobacillus helveticus]|nr:hypothetical protein [Lactobacillus helveticus]